MIQSSDEDKHSPKGPNHLNNYNPYKQNNSIGRMENMYKLNCDFCYLNQRTTSYHFPDNVKIKT